MKSLIKGYYCVGKTKFIFLGFKKMEENTSLPDKVAKIEKKFSFSKLPAIPVIGIAILLIVIFVGFYFLKPKSVEQLTLDASGNMAVGNYDEAGKIYKQILKKDKESLVALNGIINANSLEGNQTGKESQSLQESEPYIDQALEQYSNEAIVLQSIGYAYESAGNYKKALEYYEKAIKVDPKSSNAWFHKGHALQFLDREEEARRAYEKAYSLDSDNPLVLIALGNQKMNDRQFDDSYKLFLNASKSSGLSPQIKSEAFVGASIADRYKISGDPKQMSQSLSLSKQAVEADPNYSLALGTYGMNLAISGNTEEGRTYLEKAINANPRVTLNYMQLSEVLRNENKYDESIKYANEAVERISNDNTILGADDRREREGLYLYSLAKTSAKAGVSENQIMLLLQKSVSLNPKMLNLIKIDYEKYGYFNQLSDNQQFLNYVN